MLFRSGDPVAVAAGPDEEDAAVAAVLDKVLDFGPKNRNSDEIRPFRLGPVNITTGQIISVLFEFLGRPSVRPGLR